MTARQASDSLLRPWFAGVLFALLALAPLTIALHYLVHPPETLEFVLAALSLVPLAWLIGEATEHAAEHTGPGIGGFLNATFGNAPELIIALIAVNDGLTEVVRGSLTGSVIGNLLLVLGAALVAGGRGRLDRYSSFLSFGLIAFATLLFLIPSIPGWDGDPDTDELAQVSAAISIVLLIVYVGVTWYSLRRHRTLHVASDEEIKGWSLRAALGVLAVATVVDRSRRGDPRRLARGVRGEGRPQSEFFVAAVIVAIVGNAAEHGGAVIVAYRGKIALAGEIALASAAQVAVFLIPAVALLSWLIDPLSLSFRPVEIAALAGSVALHDDRAVQRPVEPRARRAAARRLRRGRGRVLPRRRPLARNHCEQRLGDQLGGARDVVVVDLEVRDRTQHRRVRRRRQADAGRLQPRERLAALEAERREVDLDEVRLDLLEVDREPASRERLRERARTGVVVGEPVDVVVERVDARRGHDPGLTHRAAEEVLLAPRALHQLARAREQRAERAAEPLRETERHGVEARGDLRGRDAERDRRVEEPRAVQVDGEAELARSGDDLLELAERPDAPARGVVGVLERRGSPRAGRHPSCSAPRRPDLLGREPAAIARAARASSALRGRPRRRTRR